MKKLSVAISLILIFLLIYQCHFMLRQSYCKGWQAGYDAFEPRVITETIIELEVREVEVVREVRVEVPIPNEPREFENFGALCKFIKELDIEGHAQPDWDCDDYAYYVWFESIKMGYLMSFETDELKGQLHAINSTVIGNVCYFIEPQGGNIWSKAYLD